MIIHNTRPTVIIGPKLPVKDKNGKMKGALRLLPGLNEVDDEHWRTLMDYVEQKASKTNKKHAWLTMMELGWIKVDEAEELPEPPTQEELEALTMDELVELSERNDIPTNWLTPMAKEMIKRKEAEKAEEKSD